MKTRISQILRLAPVVIMVGFAFTGCMTKNESDPTTDGGNVVVTQEANNMGVILNESDSVGAAKVSAASADTIIDLVTKEKIIVKRHYDPACYCFIRSSLFMNTKGFERQRVDSIWLDSSGLYLSLFRPGHADSTTHVRHVTRINANTGKEVDITFKTTLVRRLSGDTIVFQWSGTLTGRFNGTEFRSSSFSITRTFSPVTGFGEPEGTLDIHRGNFEIVILFADGKATCTTKNKGVFIRITYIGRDDKES